MKGRVKSVCVCLCVCLCVLESECECVREKVNQAKARLGINREKEKGQQRRDSPRDVVISEQSGKMGHKTEVGNDENPVT